MSYRGSLVSTKKASVVSPTAATFYFLKCAAKLSAGNPVEPVAPDLALHQRFSKPSLGPSLQLSPEPVEPGLALHQGFLEPSLEPSPEPVEPDLALHQSLPDLLRNPSPEPSPEPC